jgi:putative transposase
MILINSPFDLSVNISPSIMIISSLLRSDIGIIINNMANKSRIHHENTKHPSRKSSRLAKYDYANTGYYFVTICVQDKVCRFGEIVDDAMRLNSVGRMIESEWLSLPQRFEYVGLDSFVVMPNHIHGIIDLEKGITLSRVIQAFKSISTNEYIHGVHQQGWKKFDGTFWQRSFYDHVIRNDKDLFRVQEYILNNPLSWSLDEENPDCKGRRPIGRKQGPPLLPQ